MDAKVRLLAAESDSDAWDAHLNSAHRLIHVVSMLHAGALQQLRGDPELTSLTLCPIALSSKVSVMRFPYAVYQLKLAWQTLKDCDHFLSLPDQPAMTRGLSCPVCWNARTL